MGRYSEKILELRKLGKTYKEISSELNCAVSTVSYHCKINKLDCEPNRLTDEDKIELQELYDKIGSLKKVAKLKGRSFETVQKYVKQKERTRKMSNSEAVIDWRRRKKIELVEYKGGKCEKCGYDKCNSALEFHHLDPTKKDFSPSANMNMAWNKIQNEIDKCILVCANCHREIHEKLNWQVSTQSDTLE